MAKSFKIQLKGKEQEVKHDCILQGYGSTQIMAKYQAHDIISWGSYVKNLFQGEKMPPFISQNNLSSIDELYGHIGAAVIRLVSRQQDEINRLKAELADKQMTLESKQQKAALEAIGCLDLLEHYMGNEV